MSRGEAVNRGPLYLWCGGCWYLSSLAWNLSLPWRLVNIMHPDSGVVSLRAKELNMGNGWFCDVNRRLSFEQVINSILCKLWWIGSRRHFWGGSKRLKVVFTLFSIRFLIPWYMKNGLGSAFLKCNTFILVDY